MSDLIDRQDALFALGTITMYKGSIPYDTAVERIKKLKPALSTNLAEVGTDCISRRKAINALTEWSYDNKDDRDAVDVINGLPPIQSEIVRCEECKYHHQRNCPIEKYFSLDGFCSRGDRGTT